MNRKSNENGPPAIVLGSGLNGLGVARSLHAAGVSVWLADIDVTRPEMRTRCARPLRLATLQGNTLINELIEYAGSIFVQQQPVLLLTQEHTVRTLADAQDALSGLFRFVLPAAEVLHGLMHKWTFDALARESGLSVPLSRIVRSSRDVEEALASLSMPVVIKPGLHVPQFEALFRKAYFVKHREDAWTILNKMLHVLPDLIVQEWIPGNDADVYFCLQQISVTGSVEASFVGRKMRAWPPGTGGTASCVPAPEAAELTERTAHFFRRTGVCGLAGMEYKRHSMTGEYVAIEPTVGRTDYQEEVATLNNINLPYIYYLSAVGREGASPHGSPSVSKYVAWRDSDADFRSLARPDQVVRDWPKRGSVVSDALWRWSDPWPWIETRRQRILQNIRSNFTVSSRGRGDKKQ